MVKKFKIKFGNSPVEKPTRKESVPPKKTHKERKKPTRLNFEDEITGAPSDELSQKTVMATTGGETLPYRDITDYEWAMQYIDSNKKVVLVTARNKGSGQIGKERTFMYGRLLRLDYECKIYVGLTTEEAKLLAWDHNNDNDYRQKMSSIERIRFFHHEYLDVVVKIFGYGVKPSEMNKPRMCNIAHALSK